MLASAFRAYSLDSIIYANLSYGVKTTNNLLKVLPFHISVLQS